MTQRTTLAFALFATVALGACGSKEAGNSLDAIDRELAGGNGAAADPAAQRQRQQGGVLAGAALEQHAAVLAAAQHPAVRADLVRRARGLLE